MPHPLRTDRRPLRGQVSAKLAPRPASATVARHAVRRFLGGALTEDQLHRVELLTSELVTNAVVHAARFCELELSCPGDHILRVEVSDPIDGAPAVQSPEPTDTHGHGLMLVAALATTWGVESTSRPGKTVWFELRI